MYDDSDTTWKDFLEDLPNILAGILALAFPFLLQWLVGPSARGGFDFIGPPYIGIVVGFLTMIIAFRMPAMQAIEGEKKHGFIAVAIVGACGILGVLIGLLI